jgi:hypothetical protein
MILTISIMQWMVSWKALYVHGKESVSTCKLLMRKYNHLQGATANIIVVKAAARFWNADGAYITFA